jgi:hypothetical protein
MELGFMPTGKVRMKLSRHAGTTPSGRGPREGEDMKIDRRRVAVIGVAVALCSLMATLVAPASARDDPSFEVRMLQKSYVTFQVGHHPPSHERYGYFPREAWHQVKSCRLRATHDGDWVRVELGNHRLTNPHPFRVRVRCRPGS